ncbi:hypothetical protein VNI00_011029 [Paramarasmius palmivorus]|uniref:Retrotransposon gag domain-containing protein n=1 Tax=Paramarasmius palmivorus TaxID=297713 RepID=A0AAW0CEX4_9AGAR
MTWTLHVQEDRSHRRSAASTTFQPVAPAANRSSGSDNRRASMRSDASDTRSQNNPSHQLALTAPSPNRRVLYVYDDTPYGTGRKLRHRIFARMVETIESRLHVSRPRGPTPRIPLGPSKMKTYRGECDIIVLDDFLRNFIFHCEAFGLTGPPRVYMDDEGWVVSSQETLRVHLLGAVLKGSAEEWFKACIQVDRPEGEPTLLEVFEQMFYWFIQSSAINKLKRSFDEVEYTSEGGIRKVFLALKRSGELLPERPGLYSFKETLLKKMPKRMRRHVLHGGVSAESSLQTIMERAVSWEVDNEQDQLYSQPR